MNSYMNSGVPRFQMAAAWGHYWDSDSESDSAALRRRTPQLIGLSSLRLNEPGPLLEVPVRRWRRRPTDLGWQQTRRSRDNPDALFKLGSGCVPAFLLVCWSTRGMLRSCG